MLYNLVAIVNFTTERQTKNGVMRKHHGEMRQVLAVGTKQMLVSESKRWTKVASVWAHEAIKAKFPDGTFGTPRLHVELVQVDY